MLGSVLDSSSGAPEYSPHWHSHATYVFAAHYFFELFNETTNETDAHAAYGDLFPAEPGETLWTSFALSPGGDGEDLKSPRWTLQMGVVGDAARTSTLSIDRPYMGLRLHQTESWAEPAYKNMCLNACWELYGADDAAHLPSSGANYELSVTKPRPDAFDFAPRWDQDEGKGVCPRTVAIEESHDEATQSVSWNISVDPSPPRSASWNDPLHSQSADPLWDAWRRTRSRVYASPREAAARRRVFFDNVARYELRGGAYELDEYADWTAEEFRAARSCAAITSGAAFCPDAAPSNSTGSVDFRGSQVTPVKDQGAFGTCWSFGFAETLEGLGVRLGHELTNVSNQMVIDCCPACRGSGQDASYDWVVSQNQGRIATMDSYPYAGDPGQCKHPAPSVPFVVSGCVRSRDDADESGAPLLAALIDHGPAAFGIDATCLQGYKSGVITNCTTTGIDHEVLLVGAGVEAGVPYFLAKNSWGAKWGEDGYFRFQQAGRQLGFGSAVHAV